MERVRIGANLKSNRKVLEQCTTEDTSIGGISEQSERGVRKIDVYQVCRCYIY